jgi:hypothetical protein
MEHFKDNKHELLAEAASSCAMHFSNFDKPIDYTKGELVSL